MGKIVMASGSPRRIELFSKFDLPFSTAQSKVDENKIFSEGKGSFADLTMAAAMAKAQAVASCNDGALIIGADTIVVFSGKKLGKPKDSSDAKRMLRMLSAASHEVITGLAIIDTVRGKEVTTFESTQVFFRPLADDEIVAYVKTGEPMGKAGAYAIQGLGSVFVERIEGCFFNVVGLPLASLYQLLTSFGVNIFFKEANDGKGRGISAYIKGDAG